MNPAVVLGLAGSTLMLGFLFEMMRRHHLREKYAVFWVLVAVLTFVVGVFPETLAAASRLVGVQVPANLLFFVASMVLLGVSIQHSHELGRLEERTRTLAEEVALLRMAQDAAARTAPGRQPARVAPLANSERHLEPAPDHAATA